MGLTTEQLQARKRGLGGSDAAAVLGVSPYRTAMDVWLDKRGLVESVRETEAMRWGTLLEPVIIREYQERTGREVTTPEMLQHPEHDWMLGNLDGISHGPGGPVVLEVKCAGFRSAHRWGDPGSDFVPEEYLCQVAHYMAVSGLPGADIAVLMNGSELRVYHVERDVKLEEQLIRALRTFWRINVCLNVPPAIDGSDAARAYLESLHPKVESSMRRAAPQEEALALELRSVEEQIKEAKAMQEELRNRLRQAIGPDEGIFSQDWKITWRLSEKTGRRTLRTYF